MKSIINFRFFLVSAFLCLFAFIVISSLNHTSASSSSGTESCESNSSENVLPDETDIKDLNLSDEENLIVINGKIKNNTLYEELRSNNVPASEILNLSGCFSKYFNFKYSKPDDLYTVKLTETGELKEFKYKTDTWSEFVAKKNPNGSFSVEKKDIIPEVKIAASEFVLESSLQKAVSDGGESIDLANKFAEIFSWDIDFYLYPRKNDKIQILYEKKYQNDKFSGYGKILAAKYIGKNKTFSAFYFEDGKHGDYYDAEGVPLRKMFLKVPVKFAVKTSSFSVRRFHPVLKKYKAHTGIDYGASRGTPIMATGDGKVIFSGWQGGYGKLVIIKHPNNYKTYYGHCSALTVKKGDYVSQGDQVAKVGETGRTTGPHVHYEVRINNKPVDPNTVKAAKGKPVQEKN
ncbi:MAG: peptidoglycan DD-metalloendopeptidase family protein, partial [Thermodesulfobacteriota bacterium]